MLFFSEPDADEIVLDRHLYEPAEPDGAKGAARGGRGKREAEETRETVCEVQKCCIMTHEPNITSCFFYLNLLKLSHYQKLPLNLICAFLQGAAAAALADPEAGEDRGGVRRGAGGRQTHTQQEHIDAARRRQA